MAQADPWPAKQLKSSANGNDYYEVLGKRANDQLLSDIADQIP